MLHQIKSTLLLGALLLSVTAPAQRLEELARPVPAALSAEAPLPVELAKKYERYKEERRQKYATPADVSGKVADADLLRLMSRYVRKDDDVFRVPFQQGDNYRIYNPNLRLLNSSHGRENVKGDGGKFNIKKDRMSYAILRNGNEIWIVNHSHKLVDMSEFTFSTTSEAIGIEKGNKIVLKVPTLAIAHGDYPMLHKVKCMHIASGAEYTFDVQMSWTRKMAFSGGKHILALTPMQSDVSDHLGILTDLESKLMTVVELPFVIDADGRDGADGRKGRYGANGVNQSSYTDKEGKTHTIAGTCAKAGENGQNGEDGTDGGKFVFCISPELMEAYGLDGLIATVDPGKGGKGGKGGEGGIHGKGSGCSGKAADGKDGRDGHDGQKGDFLYLLTDVNELYRQIFQ